MGTKVNRPISEVAPRNRVVVFPCHLDYRCLAILVDLKLRSCTWTCKIERTLAVQRSVRNDSFAVHATWYNIPAYGLLRVHKLRLDSLNP